MIETSKSCHFAPPARAVWLVDNGSLRAQSVFALRRQALRLGQAAGCPVEAVSVLHSNKIAPEQLNGVPAATFTPHLRARAAAGLRELLVVPYFFGPSAALTEYLPQQISRVRQEYPQLAVRIAPPLVDLFAPADAAVEEIAGLLARNITPLLADGFSPEGVALRAGGVREDGKNASCPAGSLEKDTEGAVQCGGGLREDRQQGRSVPSEVVPRGSAVVLVDHGSPQRGVSAVRDRVGQVLKGLLGVVDFAVCSMEARKAEAYAHTLPLLEQVLVQEPFCRRRVVLAPLFLSPGRHAGAGGDLAQIVERVQADHPLLEVVFCPLLGGTPEITGVLLRRLRDGVAGFGGG